MNEGQELKEAGIALVESNNTEFIEKMRRFVVYAASVAIPALGLDDDLICTDLCRGYAEGKGIKPNSPNAWGAIFKKAPDGYIFINTGRRKPSTYPSNHGRQISIFRVEKV